MIQDDWKDYRTDLINMYGYNFGNSIYNRKVVNGMNMRMCLLALGSPDEIYVLENSEEWVYIQHAELKFINDQLVKLKYL